MHIGDVLRTIRKNKGMTKPELVERSGVSLRGIEKIEKTGKPTFSTLLSLVKGLGVTLDEVLAEAGLLQNAQVNIKPTTEIAIQADDTLDDKSKKLMSDLYSSLRDRAE